MRCDGTRPKTRGNGLRNARGIQPLQGQQFGGVTVFDEQVWQAQLQHGANDARRVEGLGHGTAGAARDGALFERYQRIVPRGHLAEQGFVEVYNVVGGIDAWSLGIDPGIPRY